MNDLVAGSMLAVLCALTWGLIAICDRLKGDQR